MNPFPEYPVIAEFLKSHTRPGERFAVLGSEPALYFLANSTTFKIPADPQNLVNDCIDTGSDVHNLVVTGEAESRKWNMSTDSLKGKDESGFLKSIYENMKDYLWGLAEMFGEDGNARDAAAFVISNVPFSKLLLPTLKFCSA